MSDSLWRIQRSDSNGKLISDYEMRFDANGAIKRMVNRTPEGKVRLQVDYVNDKNGRPWLTKAFSEATTRLSRPTNTNTMKPVCSSNAN